MIIINRKIIEEILTHGLNELPIEACGYLAGKNNRVYKYFPMKNIDNSKAHFSLDPQEQFEVLRQAGTSGFHLLAIYHTHPETPARPSEEDINLAYDSEISYVIASVQTHDVKSYKIQEGKVIPEKLIIED